MQLKINKNTDLEIEIDEIDFDFCTTLPLTITGEKNKRVVTSHFGKQECLHQLIIRRMDGDGIYLIDYKDLNYLNLKRDNLQIVSKICKNEEDRWDTYIIRENKEIHLGNDIFKYDAMYAANIALNMTMMHQHSIRWNIPDVFIPIGSQQGEIARTVVKHLGF